MTSAEENARLNTAEIISAPSAEPEKKMREYLSPKAMAAYIISGIGDKNWESFSSQNTYFFNTTFLRASPTTLALVDSLCGIADALDNAISGPIIDRTRTRWGRVRPYLVATLPLWMLSAAMPWLLPTNLSQTALFFILLILQYLGSIANSFYGPAYAAILYNLTPNVDERDRLIAADTYVDLFGVWIPSLFPFFIDYLPGNIPTRYIYIGGAMFFIMIVAVFRIYGFLTLRERIPLASRQTMQQYSVFDSVKMVANCRPVWVLLIKGFFGVGKGIGVNVESYFWLNCTGKLSNQFFAGLFTGIPSYFVLPFATKLTEKMGLRNLGTFCFTFSGMSYLILYLVGYKPTSSSFLNMAWVILGLTFAGAFNSVQRYCNTALQGDMYDYVEWKTGFRNEGMLSAAMGYMGLATNTLGKLITGAVIKAIKYKPLINAAGKVVPQTDPRMLRAIWTVFSLVPAISRFLEAGALRFFNVHGSFKERMLQELAGMRAERIAALNNGDE